MVLELFVIKNLRLRETPNNSVERDGLQAALANTLRRFAAPAAPHVKR